MYIKQNEPQGTIVIPSDLKQTFENKFTLNIGKNEIVKMKNNNVLSERDLKIARFLFQFTFATAQQLHTFLEEKSTVGNIKGRLDKLVKYRILNKFMLGSYEDERIHSDALEIYCMDLGGKYLLSHYSNEDTTDWYSTVNMKTSEIVGKNLIATEFYIRLKQSVGERLVHFKSLPEMRVGKKNVIPSFEFCLKEGLHRRYFVGEVAREFDFPVYFRDKSVKLEQLLATNAWKKYYYDADIEPVLFVFAENDQTAFDVGKLLTETTELKRFRITTDERIQRPLSEKGAFLRFAPEENLLQEIKASIFKN